MMKYLSLCSGIEAASVAWGPLGWEPVGFSEIEPFPCAILSHHYPNVSNFGDMTQWKKWNIKNETIDLICGGTPCQSFSIAGLRKGLDDDRGNLALEFARIADHFRPRWLVWENVPGVLSSNGGRDFGSFLGALAKCGYGVAYRVLDAQYVRVDGFRRAIPQRRRRVFVVGYFGDWRRAAAVLSERQSLRGDTAPRRTKGEGFAGDTCPSLVASGRGVERVGESRGQDPVIAVHGTQDPCTSKNTAFALGRNNGGENVVAMRESGQGYWAEDCIAGTLRAEGENRPSRPSNVIGCFMGGQGAKAGGIAYSNEISPTLKAADGGSNRAPTAHVGMLVRRLTPVECERLMGYKDNYTRIPWRGKPAEECPDGLRYKALGNSWAINCARWLGRRIEMVDEISGARG